RYARALVDVVTSSSAGGDPRRITAQLREFDRLLQGNDELKILFTTPAVPVAKKRGVLAQNVPALQMEPTAHNFIGVILQNERIPLLSEMIDAFEQLLNERLGIVLAQITSARPLGDAEKKELDGALRKRTGKQVQLSFSLDPTLIGGVMARVGSTIYD